MGTPLLEVRGLRKAYAGRAVLDGVDLEVEDGSITAVLGPSGTGKTTLLRIVAGFEDADAGVVALRGEIVVDGARGVAAERRRVGVVPQEGALFPHLTVGGNVGFGLPRRSEARIEECLTLVGLAGLAGRRAHELSGGQQQRVALARALAPAPPLIVLDEPFSSLDAGLRVEVRDEVVDALRAAGATAMLVTHDQQEALAVADRLVVLLDGRVAQAGRPEDVYRRPASLAVARFVGEHLLVEADARGNSVLGPLAAVGEAAGTGGVAVVRPEQLRVTPRGAAADGAAVATVERVTFLGHETLASLRLADGRVVRARLHANALAPGDAVEVAVDGPVAVFAPVAGAAAR